MEPQPNELSTKRQRVPVPVPRNGELVLRGYHLLAAAPTLVFVRAAVRTLSNVLPVFILLQCMDVLTTLIFLGRGVPEGNPLVRWSMAHGAAGPFAGLVATKLIVAFLGYYCYRSGRMRALRLANFAYVTVVGWNTIAIAASVFLR